MLSHPQRTVQRISHAHKYHGETTTKSLFFDLTRHFVYFYSSMILCKQEFIRMHDFLIMPRAINTWGNQISETMQAAILNYTAFAILLLEKVYEPA